MAKFFIYFVLFSNLFKIINSENKGLEPTIFNGLVGFVKCSETNPFPKFNKRPIVLIGCGEPRTLDTGGLVIGIIQNIYNNFWEIISTANPSALEEAVDLLIKKLLTCLPNNCTFESIIDIIYNWIGIVECRGADTCIGFRLFTLIVLGTDFSGGSVCGLCGTKCTDYKFIRGPPFSLYPWGCVCPKNGCDANGPKKLNKGWTFPLTDKFCMPNYECTEWCNTQSLVVKYQGYVCNWWNFYIGPVCILINPYISPIRWCECCPLPLEDPKPAEIENSSKN